MATSLAQQLERLAVPQTSHLKRDKKRPSLLFDPSEAAGLKRETVYQIGLDGLEQLITKNPTFQQFRNNLFHATSKELERSVQTPDANKKLNETIKKFFLLSSPYFLLSCTHKALEWLVHRFYVHEYNRTDFLMLILPYHESNIFVKCVQLMKFKDTSDSFYFLKAIQKPGVHLTKHTLLTHAASDAHFLNLTAKFILSMVKTCETPSTLTVSFNFYCTIFTGVLEIAPEVNENQISAMLPTILKGLSSDVPDFLAASYVITARLVAKQQILNKLLNKLVEKLTRIKIASLKTEAVLVLIVLYQSQTGYDFLPLKALKNLIAHAGWLFKVLENLNNSGCFIYPFLEKVVKFCVRYGLEENDEDCRQFLTKLVDEMKFDGCFVGTFLDVTLDAVDPKKDHQESPKTWIGAVLKAIETQYPEQFDKHVYKIFSPEGDAHRKKSLNFLLEATLSMKDRFKMFQKLHHPNHEIRIKALQFLRKKFQNFSKPSEISSIKQSVIDCLDDDNVQIVEEALKLLQKAAILDLDSLRKILKDLLFKCLKNENTFGTNISGEILKMLCDASRCADYDLLLVILPCLLNVPKGEMGDFLERLRETHFFSEENEKLLPLKKFRRAGENNEICRRFFASLNRNTNAEVFEQFLQILAAQKGEHSHAYNKYLIMLILSNLIPEGTNLEVTAQIVEIFFIFHKTTKLAKKTKKTSIPSCLQVCAKSNRIPQEAFLACLGQAVSKLKPPGINLGVYNFNSSSDKSCEFFTSVGGMFFTNFRSESTLKFLGNVCENNPGRQVEFLLNLAAAREDLTWNCLSGAVTVSNDHKGAAEGRKILPYLLVLLHNKRESVRVKALEIAREFAQAFPLLQSLLEQKEEIVLDEQQVPQIVSLKATAKVLDDLIGEVCDPENPPYLTEGLLDVLSLVQGWEVFEKTCPPALEVLQKSRDETGASILAKTIDRLDENVASEVSLTSNAWRLIEGCLSKHDVSVLVLKRIGREVFEKFRPEVKVKVLDLVLDAATDDQVNPEVHPAVAKIFKHIDLDSDLVLGYLVKMRDVQSKSYPVTLKRRRVCVIPSVDILELHDWKKGVTVLEFLQDKKKLRNSDKLLGVVFGILKKCLDFDEQTAVEYPKQLLLSLILNCVGRLEDKSLPKSIFNVELIVQCIRASPNPQTHHHALLVLAESASLIPTEVLHHMMAIFTFMGSSLLRYDDAYSFHIISKIIDTIIPILVVDGSLKTRAEVLRVFVDVFLDVPEHRRIPMYTHLLKTLSLEENLYLFLLLIFESQVLHGEKGESKERCLRRLELSNDLCMKFPRETVLGACVRLFEYLKALPEEKDDFKPPKEVVTFNFAQHTPKQFRHYKYVIITFVGNLLTSQDFVSGVTTISSSGNVEELEKLYKDLIVNVLTYVQKASKTLEKNSSSPQAHYWKVILHHSYDVLDSINALLTPEMFLLVVKGLMQHNLQTVRKRTLELLNTKLNTDFFENCDDLLLQLIPSLIGMIDVINGETALESEQEIIIQTTLLSIKLLVKNLAHEHPDKFTKILEYLTGLLKLRNVEANVQASIVLCLAELCASLRAHAISYLPQIMPAILKVLRQQKQPENFNSNNQNLLLLSVLTSVYKILESLPLFLSPYLLKLLTELSLLINKFDSSLESDQKWQPIVKKLADIQVKIGASVPCRVIFPAVQECFNCLIEKSCFKSIGALMGIFTNCLNNLQGADLGNSVPELGAFFLNALQFRTLEKCPFHEINYVENRIIKALTTFVLKLSENSFRPLYYKIFDWAVRCDLKNERVITFYNISAEISGKLKGLFVLFAGNFVANAAQVLDSCNSAKGERLYFENGPNNVLLLTYVLKTLHNVFHYDNHKFVTKDRFETLMQPLVDQLENGLVREAELEEILTPCIVQFVVAAADDSLWKQLNYQVLLKTRHASPGVRLMGLRCLTEIVKKLGEDFLPLLPETIPFLAELMEDEEESIEKACKKSVQEMEKFLGDSLQKYF